MYVVTLLVNYYSPYVSGCITRSDYIVCLWNKYFLMFSSLLDTSLTLICLLFHFICCSAYVCGCFTRSDLFVCLWNELFPIFSSLIDSLLLYLIHMDVVSLHLNFYRKHVFGSCTRKDKNVCRMYFFEYPVHGIIVYLLKSLCCFLSKLL